MVGIRNASLSQKLMQDDKLTLEKAVKMQSHHSWLNNTIFSKETGKMQRFRSFEISEGSSRKNRKGKQNRARNTQKQDRSRRNVIALNLVKRVEAI